MATQFLLADRNRAWELMDEAVKAANSTEKFTGAKDEIPFILMTARHNKLFAFGGKEYSVSKAFRLLSEDDFHRSIDLAKSFKNRGPRAAATLAIADAVLDKYESPVNPPRCGYYSRNWNPHVKRNLAVQAFAAKR